MKKLIAAFLFLAGFSYADVLEVKDFSGGIYESDNVYNVPDNCVSDAMNVDFDDDYLFKKRNGYNYYVGNLGGGKPVLSMYEFVQSSGVYYAIYQSSTSLYSQESGGSLNQFYTSISSSVACGFTTFMDKLFFGDGVINLRYFDGSTVSVATTTYQPKYLATWQNRLWVAGDTTNPSQVVCSAFLDYTDWVLTSDEDTAAQLFDINSSDGKIVQGFFYSPNGNLGVVKNDSIWEIRGTDASDFSIRMVTNNIGSIAGGWSYRDNNIIIVSKNGIYAYDGNSFVRISDNIQNTHKIIKQLSNTKSNYSKISSNDWAMYSSSHNIVFNTNFVTNNYNQNIATGVPNNVNAITNYLSNDSAYTDSSGNMYILGYVRNYIAPSYYDYLKETKFNSSYGVEYSTTIEQVTSFVSGSVLLSKPKLMVDSSGYKHAIFLDSQSGYGDPVWIRYATSTVAQVWGICSSSITSSNLNLPYYDADIDTNSVVHCVYAKSAGAPAQPDVVYYSSMSLTGGILGSVAISTYTVTSGIIGNVSVYISTGGIVHAAWGIINSLRGYDITYSSKSIYSGSFSPPVVSTTAAFAYLEGIYANAAKNPYIVFSRYDGSTDYDVYITSKTGASWTVENIMTNVRAGYISQLLYYPEDDEVCMAFPGGANGSLYWTRKGTAAKQRSSDLAGQYQRCVLVPTSNSSGTALKTGELKMLEVKTDTSLTQYTMSIMNSSFTYISSVYDSEQTLPITFGNFNITASTSNHVANYFLRSSDTVSGINSTSYTSINNNTTPSMSAARYMQLGFKNTYRDISWIANSLSNMVLRYDVVADQYFLSCENYDNKNYIFISTATFNNLDLCLVYDQNNSWTKYDFPNIKVKCIKKINESLYFGDDSGDVYVVSDLTSDYGYVINSYITTKDYFFDSVYKNKTPDTIYISAENTSNTGAYVDLIYYYNGYFGSSSIPTYYSGSASITSLSEISSMKTNVLNYKYVIPKRIQCQSMRVSLSNNSTEKLNLNNILINYRPENMR